MSEQPKLDIENDVPVIDLSVVLQSIDNNHHQQDAGADAAAIIEQVAHACSTYGFFQVTNHGISMDLITKFRQQLQWYFEELPLSEKKNQWKRHQSNARGFFDDELTKQKRDWKQCLDVGVPKSRDWKCLPDDHPDNCCMDGWNQFPSSANSDDDNSNTEFRNTVTQYFDECSKLSHTLAVLMAKGIDPDYETKDDNIVKDLQENHTSYLRTNYYPKCSTEEKKSDDDISPLGISPHKDAGFLTVLLQDDDCHSLQVYYNQQWVTVHPVPGALTINTGDMAQIWSNGRYQAPLHRVLTNPEQTRYSAPYFYNPGYATWVQPANTTKNHTKIKYHPVLWGYFRAVRFAGDLTDLGVEIQIDNFEKDQEIESHHLEKQNKFLEHVNFDEPFSVDKFRDLLVSE